MGEKLNYNNYVGTVEYDEEKGLYFGEIQILNTRLLYKGVDLESVEKNFQGVIDDYFELFENGEKPYDILIHRD